MSASEQTKVDLVLFAGEATPVDLVECYRLHGRYVLGIANRITGNAAEAEEILQDVFIDAMSGLSSVRERGAVRGWLAKIAVRKAMRRLRLQKYRRWLRIAAPAVELPANVEASAEQRVIVRSLYATLDKLPVDARTAWILHHIEGETLENVATMLSLSLATVKRRVALAQLTLEEALCE